MAERSRPTRNAANSEAEVRRRANTRARVLDAAVEVFAERGARRVTVDDLVTAAGFTRGAFYSNFSSIEEVLLEAFKAESERMLGLFHAAMTAPSNDQFNVAEAIAALGRAGDRWFVLQTEMMLFSLRDDQARRAAGEQIHLLDNQLRALIAEVLKRLGRVATVSEDILAQALMAAFMHSLASRVLHPDSDTADELLENLVPQLLEGLSVPALVQR
jgi:AcrR family transcriptional regulator